MGRSRPRGLILWTLAAVVGAGVIAWTFPRNYPLFPTDWEITKREAREIALERFRDLGEPVENPYVVTSLSQNTILERRMLQTEQGDGATRLKESPLGDEVLSWRVRVYPAGAQRQDWFYRANLSPEGKVLDLQMRIPAEDELPDIDPAEARRRADEFLLASGFVLTAFSEPEERRDDLQTRTDRAIRYTDREALLGEEVPYGVEVTFAGDRLTGYQTWVEDPDSKTFQSRLQGVALAGQLRILAPFLLFPFVAVFFLRRYHEGEIGVRRAIQVFLLVFGAGALLMMMTAKPAAENVGFGILSRRQTTWAWGVQLVILWWSAVAMLASLAWSVGEAQCRERWGHKLAAFDALFQGIWRNATVARSSLLGLAAGVASTAAILVLALVLRSGEVLPQVSFLFGPWWEQGSWAGITNLLFNSSLNILSVLFICLFLLPPLVRRLGRWLGGLVASVAGAIFFWPVLQTTPLAAGLLLGFVEMAILVALFLAYDLLTPLLAAVTSGVLLSAMPFLLAQDPFLQLQGALPLLLVAMPLLVSLKDLAGGKEFEYRYQDIPPHVRRIAERERQRVELETARRIQSSILPELPSQLSGVELAHSYLPATEVGGDFYDVLRLEDGRLALAVGDVAGHGVSSGLVMSMAKSALAVQTTFDPEVEAVFRTLNRTVYQSARKRLLATLCYAVLDPQRRELTYASAGHLFPYVVRGSGRVDALESVAYPLGVRDHLEVRVRTEKLELGDTLVLFSDGVVEACRGGTDEPYGFDRLEESLQRHAGQSPGHLRDAILEDLRDYTGPIPREDDQTILVARLP